MKRAPKAPYKPEPAFNSSSRIAAVQLSATDEAVFYVANGARGPVWGVAVFHEEAGKPFVVVSRREFDWTAKGEASARKHFAAVRTWMTATSAVQVSA